MQTPTLPIDAILPSLVDGLITHNSCILQAEPGAGKSTRVPLALLNQAWAQQGKILLLEPRRVAAVSLAHFLSQQLHESVGQQVGYRVRQDQCIGPQTRLEVVTDAVLVRMLLADPELRGVVAIIFDEFHERSVHVDTALMLSREVQQSLRPDLRLLVMSATLDTEQLADYLAPAQVFQCPGRAFPVTVSYQPVANDRLSDAVVIAVRRLLELTTGDILVFLPGRAEITQSLAALQATSFSSSIAIYPLHAGLTLAEQHQVLTGQTQQQRRVICSTNIAETSLTIEGITGVVDAGFERVNRYDPRSGLSQLVTTRVSQASAEQRSGRAGRVCPGYCIRLWSVTQQASLEPYRAPEILRAELDDVVMTLAQWGIYEVAQASWITAPAQGAFAASQARLVEVGILNQQGRLTPVGKVVSAFALHPRFALMIVRAAHTAYLHTACELATLLTDGTSHQTSQTTDITQRLLTDRQKRGGPLARRFNDSVIKLIRTAATIPQAMALDMLNTDLSDEDAIAVLLFCAFPERIAQKREGVEGRFLLAQGKGAHIPVSDPLAKSQFLVAVEVDSRQQDGRIFTAAAMQPATALRLLSAYSERKEVYWFDEKNQRYRGELQSHYRALVLQRMGSLKVPSSFVQHHLKEQLKHQGLTLLDWHARLDAWWGRLQWLGSIEPRMPQWSKERLLAEVDVWLLPYIGSVRSLAELRELDIFPLVKGLLDWPQQQQLDQLAPAYYTSNTGKAWPIDYAREAGPMVSVPLQEMFGEPQSPLLAGKVPLTFDLLSPARRTLQITSDLAHFWTNAYQEVAKEMRSRYPKHRWPDNPAMAHPGASLKRHFQ